MPIRSDQHRIDDEARTAVENVFASGGLATEVVQKDYGEDLLIQVSIDDEVQPARSWVQVKGTRNSKRLARRDDTYAVRIETHHLLRWARSADLVLLVLWDVSRNCGWWVPPKAQVDQYALYMNGYATQTVRVPARLRLDKQAVQDLAWQITLEHFSNLIIQANASAQVTAEIAAMDEEHPNPETTTKHAGATVLKFDVLRLLSAIDENGISKDLLRMMRNSMANMERDPSFPDDRSDLLGPAAMLCLLGLAEKRAPGVGLPHGLLGELTDALVPLLAELDFEAP